MIMSVGLESACISQTGNDKENMGNKAETNNKHCVTEHFSYNKISNITTVKLKSIKVTFFC